MSSSGRETTNNCSVRPPYNIVPGMIIRKFNTITHTIPLSDIQTQNKSLVATSKGNAYAILWEMPTTSKN